MTIGERIRATRKEKLMTQKQLGEKCQMADSAIRKYESGAQTPKIETLRRIAAALGVDINWLMNGYTLEQRDQAMKDYVSRRFTEAELGQRLQKSYEALTLEGKGKAVERVEELTEIPKYSVRFEALTAEERHLAQTGQWGKLWALQGSTSSPKAETGAKPGESASDPPEDKK